MHYAGPLDLLPICGVFLATVAVILLAVEGGFRLGQYRRRRSEQDVNVSLSDYWQPNL